MGTRDLRIKQLQAELERQGRVPAPPPRRQFVEELLTRIQVSAEDDVQIIGPPEPVSLVDRRAVARLRVIGALAIAAALLVVVGVYSQVGGSNDGAQVLMTSTGAGGGEVEVEVKPDGSIVLPNGERTAEIEAQCKDDGRFELPSGPVNCQEGESFRLRVENGKVIGAELVPIPVV